MRVDCNYNLRLRNVDSGQCEKGQQWNMHNICYIWIVLLMYVKHLHNSIFPQVWGYVTLQE